jgi:hypothetical protein
MVEEKKAAGETSGLKPAQVVASALAAVTAAFLGSTLGVAGTVTGAGIASLVTTVGSEVYLRSLRKTRAAALRTKEIIALADANAHERTRFVEPPTRRVNPLFRENDPTVRLPQPTPGADEQTVFLPQPGQIPAPPKRPWWKSRWPLLAGTSVAAFVIGILALTGFETVAGHTVSGQPGTTVGRIGGANTGDTPSTTTVRTTTATETPSSTSSATPTSEPSSATTTTPTSAPATSSAPSSAQVTPTPTPSASPASP